MWTVCFVLSFVCFIGAVMYPLAVNRRASEKQAKIKLFHALILGVFTGSLLLFLPIHCVSARGALFGWWRAFLLSVFNSMQVFAIGCDYVFEAENMGGCPGALVAWYQNWAAVLFVFGPVLTFGFVLSLAKNLSAYLKYLCAYYRDVYIFSELNEKSLVLAGDIKKNHGNAVIVFTDVFEDDEESTYERIEGAKRLGAICFKKDILAVDFSRHASGRSMLLFAIGTDETENLNQGLKLIEEYRDRRETHIYIFSTKLESELLLSSVDKGEVKVRRINEVQSLVNRVLFEQGSVLFDSAVEASDGRKKISAAVVGIGRHGMEMIKALAWFCQMDGYCLEVNAYDRDPLAEEKMIAAAPELMSPDYNGVDIAGEAQYKITIHPGVDVESVSFAEQIGKLRDATYVIVALGNDDININTAVKLRMYFERMKIHPVIQTIIYNSQQRKALAGIRNYRGQAYDIDFIGDIESSYTEAVIVDSELEEAALQVHLKWGQEEEFWTYEYNYRSSMASAIHMNARIRCGIPGAAKREAELTEEERDVIEKLEHRRWNAYMRAEGYIFSGSKEKSSRNDLAKMHHDLVDFSSLTEEEKRKDSRVGTKA